MGLLFRILEGEGAEIIDHRALEISKGVQEQVLSGRDFHETLKDARKLMRRDDNNDS